MKILSILFIAASSAVYAADPVMVSEHDTERVGYKTAINLLSQNKCILPDFTQKKKWQLWTDGLGGYLLKGNDTAVTCLKYATTPAPSPLVAIALSWNSPTTRANGAALMSDEIAGYDITYTRSRDS